MKAEKTLVAAITFTCVFAMAGCASTLFFPAKSAEKAADRLISEIWPDLPKPAGPTPEAKKT